MLRPVRHASRLLQSMSATQPGRRGRHLLALAVLLLATPVLADPRMEGRFQGRGEGRLELQVLSMDDSGSDGSDGRFFVDAGTSLLNECTGSLRGIAEATAPRTLRLRRRPFGSDETCELTLRFSPDNTRVSMSEDNCLSFHGAACAFIGTLRRR